MTTIQVYLEEGFDHDRVVVTSSDSQHTEPDVTTRHQVGLASVVELDSAPGAPTTVRIALPERGLTTELEIDPATTPYVRVNVTDGALRAVPQPAPPMFA
ncbi:hypothetical protein [Nocardioides gilvus]|uniref:hypothetical protein n=1 Tax=Nocardioides gilvus TaxID=1735589 RepID=UPI000D74CE4B|nr:hypothetical protein [Nocardioides gilvus]